VVVRLSGSALILIYDKGVWLAKNDFRSVLQKTGFRIGFGFTELTVVSVFRFSFFALCIV